MNTKLIVEICGFYSSEDAAGLLGCKGVKL